MFSQKRGRVATALLLGVSSITFAAPAFAQAAPPPDEAATPDQDAAPLGGSTTVEETVNLGNEANETAREIIVTAQRRRQSLQDVPMSVDVVTGEQIQRLNIFDAKDVQQLSPGLELTNTNGQTPTATLRGIPFDPASATNPSVDLYFNDIPLDAGTAFNAIYDVDQIEVLRGPQGALRGRTAPAGAITFRTRRPSLDEYDGYVQGTVTDDRGYNLQGAVSAPIIPGKLGVRVAGVLDGNRLNQVYNVNRDEHSRSRTKSLRGTLSFQPIDDLRAVLSHQYLKADNRQFIQVFGPGFQPLLGVGDPRFSGPNATVDDRFAVNEGESRFVNRTHLTTLSADWDLGPVSLAFVGGRQHTKTLQVLDTDVSNAVPGYASMSINNVTTRNLTAELRLLSNNEGGFWNWSLGAFYSRGRGQALVNQQADNFFAVLPPEFGVFLPVNVDITLPLDGTTKSLAASSRFQLNDKLRLEVAARYSIFESDRDGSIIASSLGYAPFFIPPFSSAIPAFPDELRKAKEKPITGGATLTYEASRDLTLYAAYGRSYRARAVGIAAPQGISNDLLETKAEKSDAIELGAKSAFLDRRLSVNANVFYQKFDGFVSRFQQIYVDQGTRDPVTGLYNGIADGVIEGTFDVNYNGDATVKGVELTFIGKPTDNWDFSVGASFVRARFDNAAVPCNDFNGDGEPNGDGVPSITGSGNVSYCETIGRLADAPDFNVTANTEYRFAMGAFQPFVRGLFVHRPKVYSERQDFQYRARQQVNLFLGVRDMDNRWEFMAFVKNALNQNRLTNVFGPENNRGTSTPGVEYRSGYRLINSNLPREFGLTGTLRF